jgi:hypothetical protein
LKNRRTAHSDVTENSARYALGNIFGNIRKPLILPGFLLSLLPKNQKRRKKNNPTWGIYRKNRLRQLRKKRKPLILLRLSVTDV